MKPTIANSIATGLACIAIIMLTFVTRNLGKRVEVLEGKTQMQGEVIFHMINRELERYNEMDSITFMERIKKDTALMDALNKLISTDKQLSKY